MSNQNLSRPCSIRILADSGLIQEIWDHSGWRLYKSDEEHVAPWTALVIERPHGDTVIVPYLFGQHALRDVVTDLRLGLVEHPVFVGTFDEFKTWAGMS